MNLLEKWGVRMRQAFRTYPQHVLIDPNAEAKHSMRARERIAAEIREEEHDRRIEALEIAAELSARRPLESHE